jgi:hypothetical protein
MRAGHFLHCRDCATLFRPSPADRASEFRMTADGYAEIVRDDCMEFLTRHARHRLETLRPTHPHAVRTGALWDATAPTYWEVSNGTDTAVVEGRRSGIGEALRYRLRSGRIVAERVGVEIAESEVRQQIDRALYPGVAPERKLAAFVAAFKRIVWDLDPDVFEVLYDVPGDPTLAVAKLPAPAVARLVAEAERLFDRTESLRISAALAQTDEEADAFSVLLRQRVRLES